MAKTKYYPPIKCAECGKDLSKSYNCKYCDADLCFDCWDAHESECSNDTYDDYLEGNE